MHTESYAEMKRIIDGRIFAELSKSSVIIDYGSQSINGTYRDLIAPRWSYLGVDIAPGRNVDHVCNGEYDSGLPDDYADGLICGQVLEHCRDPFRLVAEMARICKPGAFLVVTAPASFPEHKYPIDCWRFLPDGMVILFDRTGVKCWRSYMLPCALGQDCWYIGQKK